MYIGWGYYHICLNFISNHKYKARDDYLFVIWIHHKVTKLYLRIRGRGMVIVTVYCWILYRYVWNRLLAPFISSHKNSYFIRTLWVKVKSTRQYDEWLRQISYAIIFLRHFCRKYNALKYWIIYAAAFSVIYNTGKSEKRKGVHDENTNHFQSVGILAVSFLPSVNSKSTNIKIWFAALVICN